MGRIVLSYMAYLTVLYFSTLSNKCSDLREHIIEHMTRVQICGNTLLNI